MEKIKDTLIKECRNLRHKGYSLGEIAALVKVPKTTLYAYVKDMRLGLIQLKEIENRRKEKNKDKINPRKGKR